MRYTRKDVSELLETVNGGPDVTGFSGCFPGANFVLVASGGGTAWQNIYNPNHRICEDGTTPTPEDIGRIGLDCTVR
ncbi:MAG TPA: hypothetical protein VF815_35970 [Myxococcaceae bacterium]|jgi:hypothetical protein